MRKLLAARLRSIADRIDPRPLATGGVIATPVYVSTANHTVCNPATFTWTSWPQS